MTAYPTDFPGAGYGLEPVQPELVMGIDPLLTLLLGVVVVAAIAASYLLGYHFGRKHAAKDVVDKIYDAVKNDLKAAMGAGNSELAAKAETFMATLRRHFGDLMGFSADLNKMVGSLKSAMSGVIKVDAPVPANTCHPLTGKACACGGHDCGARCSPSSSSSAAAAASAGGPVIVNVLGGSAHTETPTPQTPPPPPAPPTAKSAEAKPAAGAKVDKTLSVEEQRDLISKHLRDFHTWWSAEHDRKTEMRGIRDGLNTAPPPKPPASTTSGGFWSVSPKTD